MWSKIVAIYSLGRVCTMKWKKEWRCLNRVNSLIKQYRMMRPFGGCSPEFGVNHVYLCVPLLWCMCDIICLNDSGVPIMWKCASKPCVLSFKIVLWFAMCSRLLGQDVFSLSYVLKYFPTCLLWWFFSLKNKGKRCEAWLVLIINIIRWSVTALLVKNENKILLGLAQCVK